MNTQRGKICPPSRRANRAAHGSRLAAMGGVGPVVQPQDVAKTLAAVWALPDAACVTRFDIMPTRPVVTQKKQQPKDRVRGRIVNLTSVDAFKAHPQNAHYAATRAAVVSLTRGFAHHLAGDGIVVNSAAPASMATDRAKELGIMDERAAASPLGRAAEPAGMAQWVLMAGGPKNTDMTGEQIIVPGGCIHV